jgi:hypothetical protein
MYESSITNVTLIHIDVPDHSVELKEIECTIESVKMKLNLGIQFDAQEIIQTERLKQQILKTLNQLGRLSQKIFDLEDDLKSQYEKAYINTPLLGKTLYQKHNSRLHKRYDLYKNRCYKLLEIIEKREKKLINNIIIQ